MGRIYISCLDGAGALGGLEGCEAETGLWARSSRLFLSERKNHREAPMRQLRVVEMRGSVGLGREQFALDVGSRR